MGKPLTILEIVEKSKKIHDNKYDYTDLLKFTEYKNNRTKIPIICKKHGKFYQSAKDHTKGKEGCLKCRSINSSKRQSKGTKQFIIDAQKIHGNKFDYSQVIYINSQTKVIIICKKHGSFEQKPNNHLQLSHGCPKCGVIKVQSQTTKSIDQFIIDAQKVHGDFYDYSITNYKGSHKNVKIICPVHGIFSQEANSHIKGKGCSSCNKSTGEERVSVILHELGIIFEHEKRIDCLKLNDSRKHRLDFYFTYNNQECAIEYDGIQHFHPVKIFGGDKYLEKRIINDKIKTIYCLKNNIRLLRISHKEYHKIKEIVDHFLLMTELPMTFKYHCVY